MRLPTPVSLIGYAGLIPFFLGPAWLSLSPQTIPDWMDAVWLSYCALIAAFMAGSLWGFALPACEGAAGLAGLLIAMALMLLAWFSTALPFAPALAVLALTFVMLLVADFWRERSLGTVGGYFALRSVLTIGVLTAMGWRYAISASA
ncbi:DUF3429 domain-containing protein [Panacagrimonas sp.]|uniref:DUF3429 domain-containing protein n=1 Tax=Panacagrimonas sp. TaxID=2480088 RepID=UPI003B528999